VSTLGLPAVLRALRRRRPSLGTASAAIALEGTARLLGSFDARVAGREHRVWKAIPSTKDLSP
jgi:hypothetical protein